MDEVFRNHYYDLSPVGALEEQLIEAIAAWVWRLRRVPQIDAGIFAYCRYSRDRQRASGKATALSLRFVDLTDLGPLPADADAHAAAKEQEIAAERDLEGYLPVLGEVFGVAERSLGSLGRYESTIMRHLCRARADLRECQEARRERRGQAPTIIDVSDDMDPAALAKKD